MSGANKRVAQTSRQATDVDVGTVAPSSIEVQFALQKLAIQPATSTSE